MDIDERTLASGDQGGRQASALWWRQRSGEELRSMMREGLGSPVFEGASTETERRAREHAMAEEKALLVERERRKRVRRLILETILLICLAVLVWTTRSHA